MQSVQEGSRYVVLNSFDALDAEGEYVLKRNALSAASRNPSMASGARLYFIPPVGSEAAEMLVSVNDRALITLSSAQGVTISNLTLEATRGSAMSIESSQDCAVLGVVFNAIGTSGIADGDGTNLHVNHSTFRHMGRRAVSLTGGVRSSLTPSGNIIANNQISESPRRSLHYGEAIELSGVGNLATSNLIFNSPSAVFELTGNDHIIELNLIHHVRDRHSRQTDIQPHLGARARPADASLASCAARWR